jgi:hypothetical protein
MLGVLLQSSEDPVEIEVGGSPLVALNDAVPSLDVLELVVGDELTLQRIVVLVLVQLVIQGGSGILFMQTVDRQVVETLVTVELYHGLLLRVQDDNEHLLPANLGQLNGLPEKASLPLVVSDMHICFCVVLYKYRFHVECLSFSF